MDRRRFLSVCSVTVLSGTAGCTGLMESSNGGNGNTEPEIPESMHVETLYPDEKVLDSDQFGEPGFDGEPLTTIIDNQETASEFIERSSEEISSFVEQTDFEVSYLLVIRRGMRSRPRLELSAISRDGEEVHVTLRVIQPEGDNEADHVTQSFVIRITDETNETPESVSAEFVG